MKRDLDLARQLLLEIERHGAECSLEVLRGRPAHSQEAEERTRYHLRLLVDTGLVREIDRTTAGVPCVRLTSAGHEMIELSRSEPRWREAKAIVMEQTGGLSLGVVRALLTKWALASIARGERYRRWRRSYPSYYERDEYRGEPGYRVDSYRYEREPLPTDEPIRLGPPLVDEREPQDRWDYAAPAGEEHLAGDWGISLPVHMI